MDHISMNINDFKEQVLHDYRIVISSRIVSEIARQEVMQGRANFAITGRGKEIPLIVLSKFFEKGDFYSGYYRDQTFILAKAIYSTKEIFSQLYGDTTEGHEPSSGGRQMINHFATPFVDKKGNFLNLSAFYNIPAFSSCLATQAPRTLGLAQASLLYRKYPHLREYNQLSKQGNEVVFCTIGDASTSEGLFWETINAAAVMQIPLAMFVWDDGFGISVPTEYQTAQGSISVALSGMGRKDMGNAKKIKIYELKGWDYIALHKAFEEGIRETREEHTPVLFHVKELTQLLGHSTSGSHQRYKSTQQLEWEKIWDGIAQFKSWILEKNIADDATLLQIENEVKAEIKKAKEEAYNEYLHPIKEKIQSTIR
ncbi:MAG: thiamine pyrophosphate-dependent dehydrogenase E1 component subunit alpha, partial [Chitinophagaceae bacterium]